MNRLTKHQTRVAVVVVIACAALVCAGAWRASVISASKEKRSAQTFSPEEKKRIFHERVRKGVGSEVRFVKSDGSPEDAAASVVSLNSFIYGRAGFKMSEETKQKLTKLEHQARKGEKGRISVEEVSDILAATLAARAVTLTDEEVTRAADTFEATPEGDISTRANGRWGSLKKEDFIRQVKEAREMGKRSDTSLRDTIRSFVDGEVKSRVTTLSEAVPEQFGDVSQNGLTPAQTVLILYSVAADDPLNGSQGELRRQVEWVTKAKAKQAKQEDKAQALKAHAYGVHGTFQASPLDLIFNKETMQDLLDRMEKGGNKK